MTAPASGPALVSRCICMRFPFDELLPLARAEGWDLGQVMEETGCGTQCGLCRPYLRRMLRTGETEFRELLEPDAG
jgi:bacterioferritin-associated ferredoxin